jgi:hypothetical protein
MVAEPFTGEKRKLRVCENAEAAFGLIDPEKYCGVIAPFRTVVRARNPTRITEAAEIGTEE